MLGFFSFLAQAVFLLIVIYFVIYVLLEVRILLVSGRVQRRRLAELSAQADSCQTTMPCWPKVTVFLPIYNESAVVERLIDAVCSLRYNPQQLEILVLDDSTDLTSSLAVVRVVHHAAQGVNIRLLRRKNRKGYKAGNLINGIQHASGEFYAIFDADFVPPVDFLEKTIPCFQNPRLGFLQTAIGYENHDVSFLTRFQAMEMGHQQYITVGLSEAGNMASLSGSSCVWRKACVDALGGWNDGVITEDVDLGYRAQIDDWDYAYLPEVVSMSVLPETASAYRTQRERWGRGLLHSAFKHIRQMARQKMPLMKRLHALSMMFSSLLLASIYVLVLLTLPLNFLVDFSHSSIHWVAPVFFVIVAIWALYNAFGARKGTQLESRPGIARTLWDTYLYVSMFLPMAWHYFFGGIRAMFGVYGDFNRTPKGSVERKQRKPSVNRYLWLGEAFTFVYSLIAILVELHKDNYFLIPMNLTVCVGFGMMLYWTWQEGCLECDD